MCQMSVVLQQGERREKIMDAVARLVVTGEGVVINALFETPVTIAGGQVTEIDFLDGVVVVTQPDTNPSAK